VVSTFESSSTECLHKFVCVCVEKDITYWTRFATSIEGVNFNAIDKDKFWSSIVLSMYNHINLDLVIWLLVCSGAACVGEWPCTLLHLRIKAYCERQRGDNTIRLQLWRVVSVGWKWW